MDSPPIAPAAPLRVSSRSDPNKLAGAIAGVVRTSGQVELQGIGAGAVNQLVKGIAIARGFLVAVGSDLVCFPIFTDIMIDGECRTAILFKVFKIETR